MSWITSIAKNALKEAKKTIDKALDISETNETNFGNIIRFIKIIELASAQYVH